MEVNSTRLMPTLRTIPKRIGDGKQLNLKRTMKKIYFALAAVAAVFAGCSNEVEPEQPTPVIVIEKNVSLSASVGDPLTKVSSDNAGIFKWQSTDKITAVTNGNAIRQFEVGNIEPAGTSAEFNGSIPDGSSIAYALYPASESHNANGDNITFHLDENVTWNADASGMPMIATVVGDEASFKSVGGVLKLILFNIPAEADFLKFSATSKQITGDFEIEDASSVDPAPVITTATKEGTNNELIIDFSANYSASKVFYIPLPTGTIDGFTVSLYENLSDDDPLFSVTSTKNVVMAANKLIIAPVMNCAKATVLWSEDFSTFSNNAVPSGSQESGVTYACTNGTNNGSTKIYGSDNTAGGTAPELLVCKYSGTFTVTGIPTGGASSMVLKFKKNAPSLTVSTTSSISLSGDTSSTTAGEKTVNLTNEGGLDSFDLTFTGPSGNTNVRLDDIVLSIPGTSFTAPSIDNADVTELTIAVGSLEASTAVELKNPVDGLGVSCIITYPNNEYYKWIDSAVVENNALVVTAKGANETAAAYTATVTLKASGATAKTISVTQESALVPNPKDEDLTATPGDQSVSVTWPKVEHATSYAAYLCEDTSEDPAADGTPVPAANISIVENACTLNLTELTNGSIYHLYVKVNSVDEDYVAPTGYAHVSFTPVATKELVSIELTGSLTTTTYNVGGTFSLDGATVKAWYNDSTWADVTSSCNTEYDFSTTGTKTVTISYTEGGVTKTCECNVTVAMVDVLTSSWAGTTSGSSYADWSGKAGSASDAVYAGNSNKGVDYIQIRTNNSNSGIVSTTSGGLVQKVSVVWHSQSTSGKTIDVYGKNTAYTSPSDLFNNSNQGTKIGSIVSGTSTELSISDEYEYIGIRSNSGAVYLEEIRIQWGAATPTITMAKTSISDVAADGVTDASESGVYTFKNNATDADVTVTCDGSIVTAASKNNGSITYTVAANTGAAREGWIKVRYGSESAHTVTVSQNAATYTLTLSATNGTVAATVDAAAVSSGSAVAVGKTVSITATPSSGYQLSALSYNDGSAHDIISTKSFEMPAAAVTVTATFSAVPTISMNKTSITDVPAAGVTNASESGVYSCHNGADDSGITVTCDGTIVTAASKSNGAITYSVAANSSGARDGWIKVQYGSEDPHQITVSQLSGVTAKTYTLVLSASDFSIVSYSTNDGDHVFTATASDSSTMDVTINTSNVMQSTGIQFKKSNAGVMYNKTDLGTITSLTTVAKTGKEDVSTKNIGATQNPSSNAGEGGYFKLSSTKTANLESITIVFQK